MLQSDIFEILGTAVGILYLYWEYKGDIKLWIAGIIMPAISLYVYYSNGLYADFGINIYYLAVAVYGWAVWQTGSKRSDGTAAELLIAHTPRRMYLPLALMTAVVWGAIGMILTSFTDSTVPWADAFTTAVSIVGMWMLARKWIEQWWAWLVVDAVCAVLYVYKGIYFYAALYAVYTVVVFFGYKEWKRMMALQQSPAQDAELHSGKSPA